MIQIFEKDFDQRVLQTQVVSYTKGETMHKTSVVGKRKIDHVCPGETYESIQSKHFYLI